jgi:hypothetical protein
MAEITDELINKLEEITTQTHLPLERRLIDTAVWFHRNKDRIPRHEVTRRLDFIEKAFDCHVEMLIMLVERMQLNEGRRGSESLWMPRGGTFIDDSGEKFEF